MTMTDTRTNPENVTATASPRPWRVVAYDDRLQCDIYDANGTPVCTMGHFSENPQSVAALIVDAVNNGPMLNILTADLKDANKDIDRLRDIVRRLLPSLRRDIAQCNGPKQAPRLAALLDEARAAIGEGEKA